MKKFLDEKRFHILDALIKLTIGLFILGTSLFAYMYFVDGGKEANLRLIQSKLESFSKIKIVKVGHKEDPIVLSNIFTTFKFSPSRVLTINGLSPKSFEELRAETVMRVGDWGVATLTINPQDPEEGVKIRHGFRVKRDREFLDFTNGAEFSFEQFSDLIHKYQHLEKFVLSLPVLDKDQVTEAFYKKYGKSLEKSFGFSKKYYSIRWRFKTDYLGDSDKSYGKQPESLPKMAPGLLKKIISGS